MSEDRRKAMGTFEVKDQFYLNGEPFKIISGAIHYFRVVPEYWKDRLEKLKAMGCNTVETYVPWNMHEPYQDCFCFEGILDVKKFIELASELGLWVIVRPSPYICAEWEFGGLPAWLLKEDGMHLRSSDSKFLEYVKQYYKKLFEVLTPLQIQEGGPIILFQIENEYGYYGDDTSYLLALKEMMIEEGVKVPFVTSDGPWGDALDCGKVEGALQTGNFGSKAKEQFAILREKMPDGPLMCMEFWVGWFDHWGCGKHHTTDYKENAKELEDLLKLGSVNIYMFEGGTNFGFMNGSNYYEELTPDVTSYDYDAILTESGELTPKYYAFQKVISQFNSVPQLELTTSIQTKDYGILTVKEKVGLFEALEELSIPVQSTHPQSMERLGQNYGYILYTSTLSKENRLDTIRLWKANDRAKFYMNEKEILTLYDRELENEHQLDMKLMPDSQLAILVENMGRVNFGMRLEDQRKGIDGAVQINGHQHTQWNQYPLSLEQIEKLDFTKGYRKGLPAFYRFVFEINELGDTYIDLTGWGKGVVWINGFNLGRFWEIGPQKRLYLSAPLLHQGENAIIIFETEGRSLETITLLDKPCLE